MKYLVLYKMFENINLDYTGNDLTLYNIKPDKLKIIYTIFCDIYNGDEKFNIEWLDFVNDKKNFKPSENKGYISYNPNSEYKNKLSTGIYKDFEVLGVSVEDSLNEILQKTKTKNNFELDEFLDKYPQYKYSTESNKLGLF